MHVTGLIVLERFLGLFFVFFLCQELLEVTDTMTMQTTVKTSSGNIGINKLMDNGQQVIKGSQQRFTEIQ